MTDLWGGQVLQNDFENSLCEIIADRIARVCPTHSSTTAFSTRVNAAPSLLP